MVAPASTDDIKSAALRVVISAALSLAVMIIDFGWLIRDEIKYIWPRLPSSWYARIYMLARTIGMVSQIFNVCFTTRMYFGIPTTQAGCRAWFAYQALVVQFLLASVEGTLMHRIYALFLRSRYILLVLVMFAASQVASLGVSARFSFPAVMHTDTCLIIRSSSGNAFFGATTMTTNMIIFFMTFWKYLRLPDNWTRRGVGRVVIRDSALSLFAISAIMLFLTLCSLEVIRPTMSGNITYYWLVCVLWVSIGRIIVNHEKLAREEGDLRVGDTVKGSLQLTSQIEITEDCLMSEGEGSTTEVGSLRSTWSGGFEMATSKASHSCSSDSEWSDTAQDTPQPRSSGEDFDTSASVSS